MAPVCTMVQGPQCMSRADVQRLVWWLALAEHGIRDVCDDEECTARAHTACTKSLACGHPCPGIKNEAQCTLPCMREGCASESKSDPIDGSDYCNICWYVAA